MPLVNFGQELEGKKTKKFNFLNCCSMHLSLLDSCDWMNIQLKDQKENVFVMLWSCCELIVLSDNEQKSKQHASLINKSLEFMLLIHFCLVQLETKKINDGDFLLCTLESS